MIHLYDRATMAQVASLDPDPTLRSLLIERIAALGEDLIDWTEFLIVQPGDTEDDIVRHIGLSPLIDPIDGSTPPSSPDGTGLRTTAAGSNCFSRSEARLPTSSLLETRTACRQNCAKCAESSLAELESKTLVAISRPSSG